MHEKIENAKTYVAERKGPILFWGAMLVIPALNATAAVYRHKQVEGQIRLFIMQEEAAFLKEA